MIDAVHDNIGLMHRYVSLRKKLQGVDELHMYDIYAPLIQDVKMDVPLRRLKGWWLRGLSHWVKNIKNTSGRI